MNTPHFKIDHETREVRLCYEQFHTWLKDTAEQVSRIQGILEASEKGGIEKSFSNALQHMIAGGVAECQGIAYRIKDGELQCMREYDEQPWIAWVPATEQSVDWAIRQEWEVS